MKLSERLRRAKRYDDEVAAAENLESISQEMAEVLEGITGEMKTDPTRPIDSKLLERAAEVTERYRADAAAG